MLLVSLVGGLTWNGIIDSERSTYTQKVDFAKLRSELLNADSTEAQLTRSSHEKISADLAKLNSRLRDEIGRTQASVRLDLNLEKGRIREEANSQEMRIKETETRIEQEVAGLRERVEAVKFSTLQWLMYDPRTVLLTGRELILTCFSLQGCLYRYRSPYSWCLAPVYVSLGARFYLHCIWSDIVGLVYMTLCCLLMFLFLCTHTLLLSICLAIHGCFQDSLPKESHNTKLFSFGILLKIIRYINLDLRSMISPHVRLCISMVLSDLNVSRPPCFIHTSSSSPLNISFDISLKVSISLIS